jgi:hypothetical protein
MAATIKTGSFVGTGAAVNVSLGFSPVRVTVTNETDGDESWSWQTGMTAAHALKIAADGTQTRITSNGVSAYAGTNTPGSEAAKGFTVGSALSESGKTFRYIAFGE